jgi:hypothetical protein
VLGFRLLMLGLDDCGCGYFPFTGTGDNTYDYACSPEELRKYLFFLFFQVAPTQKNEIYIVPLHKLTLH